MSIEIVTEKDRLYREHLQKQAAEAEKQAEERKQRLQQLQTFRSEVLVVRSKDPKESAEYFGNLATERGYDDLPIASIVSSLNQYRKDMQDKDLELDMIFNRVYKKILKNGTNSDIALKETRDLFLYGIGASSPDYKPFYDLYKKADMELLELQKTVGAYEHCKQEYIKANKDLIEAEREKARQRELLSSGILEELGITQNEATQNGE